MPPVGPWFCTPVLPGVCARCPRHSGLWELADQQGRGQSARQRGWERCCLRPLARLQRAHAPTDHTGTVSALGPGSGSRRLWSLQQEHPLDPGPRLNASTPAWGAWSAPLWPESLPRVAPGPPAAHGERPWDLRPFAQGWVTAKSQSVVKFCLFILKNSF